MTDSTTSESLVQSATTSVAAGAFAGINELLPLPQLLNFDDFDHEANLLRFSSAEAHEFDGRRR